MKGVYFIQHGLRGHIKIGYAINPARRLANLQCAAPDELHLLAVIEGAPSLERQLHRALAMCRHRGEWFRAAPPIGAMIEKIGTGEIDKSNVVAWAHDAIGNMVRARQRARDEFLIKGWLAAVSDPTEKPHIVATCSAFLTERGIDHMPAMQAIISQADELRGAA